MKSKKLIKGSPKLLLEGLELAFKVVYLNCYVIPECIDILESIIKRKLTNKEIIQIKERLAINNIEKEEKK